MTNTDTLITFAATSRTTRFWTGTDAAGHLAQFWTKQPEAADFPHLVIAAHVVMPLIAEGDKLSAPALPAAAQPAALSETQQYRTGYGEGVRAAAKLAETSDRALAEAIRNLQSTAPVAAPVPAAQEQRVEVGVVYKDMDDCPDIRIDMEALMHVPAGSIVYAAPAMEAKIHE